MKKIQITVTLLSLIIVAIGTYTNFVAFFIIGNVGKIVVFFILEMVMVIMAYVIFWMLFNLPEKLDEMGYKKISDELYKLLNDDNVDLSKKREKYTRIGRLDQGSILQ